MFTYEELKKIDTISNWLTISEFVLLAKEDFNMFSEQTLDFLVKSLISIFENKFGIRIDSKLKIVNRRTIEDSPETLRNEEVISLWIDGNFPFQFIYQLSHEMCHYYFFNAFSFMPRYKWFEETICELVSELSFNILSKSWTGVNLFAYVKNTEGAKNYLNNLIQANKTKVAGEIINYPALENHLEQDCYDRKVNTYFALQIFNFVKNTSMKSFFNDLRMFISILCKDTKKGFIENINISSDRIKKIFRSVFAQDIYSLQAV